jgi:quercetin dioxygenase-like cupin family protein
VVNGVARSLTARVRIRPMLAIRSVVLVASVAAGLVFAVAPAHATAGREVTATEMWKRTADGVDYTFREITLAPGGSTGWHMHLGRLYGTVKEGTLTHNLADCTVDGIYHAGSGIFEAPNVTHIGRNLGDTPVVLEVVYILPAGSPLSVDEPDPGCGFS